MWGKDGKFHIYIPKHWVVIKETNLAFASHLLLSFVTIL